MADLETEPPVGQLDSALWAQWSVERTPQARQVLVERYRELVRIIAAKTYRQRFSDELEFGDYMQFGMIGLLEAMDRFDPSLGAKFETFASHRIQGAILSGVETLSEKQQQIAVRRRVRAERMKSLVEERQPNAVESASDALHRLADIAVGLAIGFMLDGAPLYLDGEPASGDTPYEQVELMQLRRRMAELVEKLPAQERKVIRAHYFQQVQFERIAESMGLTKGRISQIHHAALKRLRALQASSDRFCLTT